MRQSKTVLLQNRVISCGNPCLMSIVIVVQELMYYCAK
ncbi:hypothetical protein NIES2104_61160 [Leptolyngbya sp. NIES-2104]|nr:hypothetical protein NIES2104_61160 [Leptolyngbya sp. NIES-2104]